MASDAASADVADANVSLPDVVDAGADGQVGDAAPVDASQEVVDADIPDGAVEDGGAAGDGNLVEGTGKPCKGANDCGPLPGPCRTWQCLGVCYPLLDNGGACEDGDPCTVGDVCFVGLCQKGQAKSCDDGNPCTVDSCSSSGACSHASAADGGVCDGGKVCKAGVCVGGIASGVFDAAAAGWATCAVVKGGKALCWGDDAVYQVGASKSQGKWFTKPEPVALTVAAQAIACGGNHCCAIASDGLYCWGDDQFGQSSGLGQGQQKPGLLAKSPTKVAVAAVAVAVGQYHTCALDGAGVVRCFGLGSSGQLGDGSSEVGSKPVVAQLPKPAQAVRCGHTHCCALVAGVPYCWGINDMGQLGLGTNAATLTPKAAKGVEGAVALALGADHACATLQAGTIMCWGVNQSGQAGGPGTYLLSPTPVAGLTDVTALGAGGAHTCAATKGKLLCFGNNHKFQAVPGSKSLLISAPTEVPGLPPGAQVLSIALGDEHSCVRTAALELYCWGANNLGQIGNGTTKDQPTPWAVP